MAKNIDLNEVIKNIVNGTFNEKLCRICLQPLDILSENIFTTVCKNDKEYCIADVLKLIFNVNVKLNEDSRICSECFIAASSAYQFYLLTRRSEEILDFYINCIEEQVELINTPEHLSSESLCITLPKLKPDIEIFDFDLSGILSENTTTDYTEIDNEIVNYVDEDCQKVSKNEDCQKLSENEDCQKVSENEDDGDIVIIADENGEPSFYKATEGTLVPVDENLRSQLNKVLKRSLPNSNRMKGKRKRNPMNYIMCSRCPVRYKFVGKLKEHMKSEHDIDLFICTVCKTVIENEDEFNRHLKTHSNIYRCAKCNVAFKHRDSIIAHLKWHVEMDNLKDTGKARICEVCGLVLMDEEQLREHYDKKHAKKYTCYYCGRMYKGEISFETHIKKHENVIKGEAKEQRKVEEEVEEIKRVEKRSKFSCGTCNREFVDDRSLMWHQRLHSNERPYICNVCGRGFVSVNRRNQHAVCAHTAPARRCPLCPALFHLRSMVNTHVKKVHLKEHKRRNRTSKYQNVFWRTEPVPIQELSVSIQNQILKLQAAQKEPVKEIEW
ncbi:zinc finger protein 547-like [Battus philenor]|uniref:zinc finger protein 547-like n=1 Tax=Battus philenor TaxID=42288 RepID=UPI0035D07925